MPETIVWMAEQEDHGRIAAGGCVSLVPWETVAQWLTHRHCRHPEEQIIGLVALRTGLRVHYADRSQKASAGCASR